MKLVLQVPAWNEEANIAATLAELPRQVQGFTAVEVLVVDDGSTDGTSPAAKTAGALVLRLPLHSGLARAFNAGLEAALRRGADVIVNIDADGQYDPAAIPELVAPILAGEADIVLGDRGVASVTHFSPPKRLLQTLGAWAVRVLSGVPVWDATTGFRALSRNAAARLNCFTTFTYTIETLIQAGQAGMSVRSIQVATRPVGRPSRLFRSNTGYVLRSLATLVRLVFLYRPLRAFLAVAMLFLAAAGALLTRFGYFYITGLSPSGHLQSLIVAAVLGITGVQLAVLGSLADLISVNRRMLEEMRARERSRK